MTDTTPDLSSASRPTRLARIGAILTIAVLAIIVWMDQATLPIGVAVEGPDGSFQSAFEFFFKHGSRAGVDWVYTYGPLGFIENLTYDSDLFIGRLILVDVLWRGACATVLTLAFLRNANALERGLAFVAIVLLPLNPDAYIYLFTLGAAELCMDRPRSRALALLAILALVPASLAKFTSFGLLVPCVVAVSAARIQAISLRAALRFAGACCVFWLALWFACRQSLWDLPAFLWNSFDMASGYASGMGSQCLPELENRAILLFFLLVAVFILPLVGRARTSGKFGPALIRLFVLFAAFKAGTVRGADHTPIFFMFAALAPFTIVGEWEPSAWLRLTQVGLRITTFCLAWSAMIVASSVPVPVIATLATRAGEQVDLSVRLAFDRKQMRAEFDYLVGVARNRRQLPHMRALVGTDTIDIQPPFQDTLLLNDMNWRPRPIFQPYAVLTDHLQRLNGEFLESDRAPEWFILKPQAIDGRLQTMEDAAALIVVARDYSPMLEEEGMLLLRRTPQKRDGKVPEVVIDRELHFGERLDLSGLEPGIHLLQLDAPQTWRGRLRAFALRPVPLHGVLSSGDRREITVRLVPGMLRTGAIIDPLIEDKEDWVRFFDGHADRTTAFTLLPTDSPSAYPETLRVRILRSPFRPAHVELRADWAKRFPMFETVPDEFNAVEQGRVTVEGGEQVLSVTTPSEIRFRLPAGRHRARGLLGIGAEAYESATTEGLTFQAHFVVNGVYRKVFQRVLDPSDEPKDRGCIPFDFEFDAEQSGDLALCTRLGASKAAGRSSAFWSRIRVE